jgi:RNA polymerase sigma factor (sigma-70 family)
MGQGPLVSPQAFRDDALLAARVGRGEPEAESELVARFRPGLLTMLRFRTRDPDTAQELASDTLMAAVAALRSGKLRESERLAGFIHGIARNLLNNFFRRKAAAPPLEPLDDHSDQLQAPDESEAEERRAVVRRAIDQLEELDRRVLSLTLLEGLKPGEIALRIRLSPEVVRMRKSRALRRVAERVQEWLRT